MKILVLNCGSSSLKYQLIDMENEDVIASGKYERIGEKESFITHKTSKVKVQIDHYAKTHEEAIDFTLKQFTNEEYKVIDSLDEINAIGHRIVHGGEKLTESVIINDKVMELLKDSIRLAPLHNPASILGIEACKNVINNKPMVAVFDTAFHKTLTKDKFLYPINYNYYEKYGIRKYGFHGTSHKYISQKYAEITKQNIEDLKIVTCHLGQGSSICAIDSGKSIDTSMGFTPLGGLPMVQRCGDIDPSVVTNIMKIKNLKPDEMEKELNKESGLYGISKNPPDFRTIIGNALDGDEKSKIAVEMFAYSIASYIAKYGIAMGKIDAIIFSGGIGEHQWPLRKLVCSKLKILGVEIDLDVNKECLAEEKRISKDSSKIEIYVIPTNEELMIAKETMSLIK